MKIGEKNQQGIPHSLDYFKASGSYSSHFHRVYGDKPDAVQIIFVSDDFRESCYEEWDGRDKQGRKAGFGDGENWYMWSADRKDYVRVEQSVKDKLTADLQLKWAMTITLTFVIPAIDGLLALWRFSTKGKASSIPEIRETFDSIMRQAGTVKFIPFDLTVKKVKSQKPGAMSTFPVVSLVPHISHENVLKVQKLIQQGFDISRIGLLTDSNLSDLKALPVPAMEYTILEPGIESDLAECDSVASLKALASGYPAMDNEMKAKFKERYEQLRASETAGTPEGTT